MDVSIEVSGIQEYREDQQERDVVYRVIENGMEFHIACRTHPHGRDVTLAGKKGFLYVDTGDNLVHFQTVLVGGGCGVSIDDDVVEGLSPSALQRVLARHGGEMPE